MDDEQEKRRAENLGRIDALTDGMHAMADRFLTLHDAWDTSFELIPPTMFEHWFKLIWWNGGEINDGYAFFMGRLNGDWKMDASHYPAGQKGLFHLMHRGLDNKPVRHSVEFAEFLERFRPPR